MDHKMQLAHAFPIGVKYGQHRDLQEAYWDRDFANMRECGIDAVRIHAFWSPIEPNEGEFHFEQYDRLVRKAEHYGVRVMFTLYLMSAPEWLFKKHPDSRFVSAAGTVWNSNQTGDNAQGGWPGLCFDSQPFRRTAEQFVKTFVLHYKGDPNILAIDIWHEPTDEAVQHGPENNWKELMFCYCEHSLNAFRTWLRRKYGTLEELNRAWTRYFPDWAAVEPPRNPGTYTDWLDWKTFRLDAVADAVRWLGAVVKKYDPERATSVHTGILEMGHPITHADDHFRLAPATDMFACSLYDAIHEDLGGFTADLMRSACENGPYWIGETGTGAGPIFSFFGNPPESYHCFARSIRPEEIFKLTWSNIAHGAKGVFFWAWRPDISTIEHLSLGFTERNGDLTDRTAALKAFTQTFRPYRESLAGAYAPQSRVCILYNMDSMLIEGLASVCRTANGCFDRDGRAYKDMLALIGCYSLCMKNGIQTDFISKELLQNGGLRRYQTLMLPYSISIDKATAEAIETFVRNGGTVIADAMLGFFTDGGWGSEVCPPHGLDKVFGVSALSDYGLAEFSDVVTQRTYDKAGCFVEEHLRVLDAEVKASFRSGAPAITAHSYGAGHAIYIGTAFFANAVRSGLNETNGLFRELMRWAGLHGEAEIEGLSDAQTVEVRELYGRDEAFVFVINHMNERCSPSVRVELPFAGSMYEIKKPENTAYCSGTWTFAEELEPLEVKIFHVKQ